MKCSSLAIIWGDVMWQAVIFILFTSSMYPVGTGAAIVDGNFASEKECEEITTEIAPKTGESAFVTYKGMRVEVTIMTSIVACHQGGEKV